MSLPTKVCPACGSEFAKPVGYSNSNFRKHRIYCSRVCQMRARHIDDEKRFWSKVDKESHRHGCWLWTAALSRSGYARFAADGHTSTNASRYAWKLTNGDIPPGMFVCHKCDNPQCVNPEHLFLGTQRDNIEDMISKGRRARVDASGERNGRAILTPEQVTEIRARYRTERTSCARLAKDYGVSGSAVHAIIGRRNWRTVP